MTFAGWHFQVHSFNSSSGQAYFFTLTGISGTDKTDDLTCEIIYDNFTCENYRFSTNHSFWTFYVGEKPVVYIINRKIHGCLEIPDLFLVLNMIYLYMFSTREINLVFPSTHVLFSTPAKICS